MSGSKPETSKGKSFLQLEWTNQHGCGDQDLNCDIIIQYQCQSNSYGPMRKLNINTIRNGKTYKTTHVNCTAWSPGLLTGLIIYMKTFRNSDWLRAVRLNPNSAILCCRSANLCYHSVNFDSCYFEVFRKLTRACFFPNCTRNHAITYISNNVVLASMSRYLVTLLYKHPVIDN